MATNIFLEVNNLLTQRYSKFRTTITNPFLSVNKLLTDRYIRYSEINDLLDNRKEGEYENIKDSEQRIGMLINERAAVFNNNPLFLLFTYYCELFNEFNRYEALLKQKNSSIPINKKHIDTEINNPLFVCEKNIKSINEKILTEIEKINNKSNEDSMKEQKEARKERKAAALEKQVKGQDEDYEKLLREFIEEENGKSHSFSNDKDFQILQDEDFVNISNDISKKKHIVSVIGDGDCFINAIFDYLIYNNKLLEMYNRLKKIHEVINKTRGNGYNLNLKNIKESLKTQDKDIIDTSSRYYDSIKDQNIRLNYNHKKDSYGNIRFTQIPGDSKSNYNNLRNNFIKSMKYTLYLYSKTIGKKDNIKMLKEYLVDPSFGIGISDYITAIRKERIKEKVIEKMEELNYLEDDFFLKKEIENNFKEVELIKILTHDDYEKIHEKYIDYYFNNNGIESDRFLIHIYNKILITRINNMPLFVIIITDSTRRYQLYKKQLVQSGKYKHSEQTFYIRILFENIRSSSGIPNHFNLIISKRNSYFNSILEDKDLLITQDDDDEVLLQKWLKENPADYYGGAKRIQAKSLQKSERVTNDPKKPSPKKPCKSKQKSRLT